MRIILLITVIVNVTGCKNQQFEEYNTGQQSFDLIDNERNRPLKVEVWYPTNDSFSNEIIHNQTPFKSLSSVKGAEFATGKFPLIIVSHGTGGNRFSLTWMIEELVKEGYIVVSLGHYGNTSFNKIPREFVKWWERAIDIQFVIDELFAITQIHQHIDKSKIGGIGFSLGGYTNIALAGGKVNRSLGQKTELPPEFPDINEEINFANDSLIVNSYLSYKDNLKDDRIKAFFVMAPSIGFGFESSEQVKDIDAPIFIVAGKGDQNTPIKSNAMKYHELIPSSELYLFDEKVGHYVFLNEGTDFGKKIIPELTIDKEGVNRSQIHDKVIELALAFFKKHLGTN